MGEYCPTCSRQTGGINPVIGGTRCLQCTVFGEGGGKMSAAEKIVELDRRMRTRGDDIGPAIRDIDDLSRRMERRKRDDFGDIDYT